LFGFSPRPGDIIYADRGLYQHYGLYAGDDKVIHFAPLRGKEINAENAIIHETTLEEFLKVGELKIDKKSKAQYSRKGIVGRARSQIGARGYNLVFNNCEHFARWCTSGVSESKQVENAVTETVKIITELFDK
jgi:cell wall-associated NlpC family hydrolase